MFLPHSSLALDLVASCHGNIHGTVVHLLYIARGVCVCVCVCVCMCVWIQESSVYGACVCDSGVV